MLLEDVVKSIPTLAVDAISISYCAGPGAPIVMRWANDSFCEMFCTTKDDVLTIAPEQLFHWDYIADYNSAKDEMAAQGKSSFSQDTLMLRPDGSSFWGGVSYVRIPDADGPGFHGLVFIRNIDDLKNREQSAELALIENQHLLEQVEAVQTRLMAAINMMPDPFAVFNSRDRLEIWNPAFGKNVSEDEGFLEKGMKKKDIAHHYISNGFVDDAKGQEEEFYERYMHSWRTEDLTGEVTKIRGRDYKVSRTTAPNGDRVVMRIDITDQLLAKKELEVYAERLEEANREISAQAFQDELTRLGNRRFLKVKLEELIAKRKAKGLELAALHIDLDRFKQINDTMGHGAGDFVLETVADVLRAEVREEDVVARTGGDEFVVLMRCRATSEAPEHLADRLIEALSKPIFYEDRPCRFGASVGIARTPVIQAEDLLTCSDIALYKAKTGGRSMKAVFDHVDLENMQRSKLLADDIFRALEHDEFEPFYQTQVDALSHEIVGIEVLARWRHPERGVLAPGDFLEVASEIQADGKIDKMIFEKAVAECRAAFSDWDVVPDLAFNVSLQRLVDDALPVDISAADYPGRLIFELVETVFFEEERGTFVQRISELRDLGIGFEVDDFGSGRASIVGLKRIGPERLKIDRRLIQPITESDNAGKLVRSIIDIGRALDIGVTAEGVETEAHAAMLKEMGCRRLQGFHFSKPSALSDVLAGHGKVSGKITG